MPSGRRRGPFGRRDDLATGSAPCPDSLKIKDKDRTPYAVRRFKFSNFQTDIIW